MLPALIDSMDEDLDFQNVLNPYESFMRKHLQHYGYYTGKNASFRNGFPGFEEWRQELMLTGSSQDDDDDDKDNKTQEELLRTTQLVYSNQQGKMVPKLREPRQLYGFSATEFGPQQLARWPAEIQVLNESIRHIDYVPPHPEPFYKSTGQERMPMARSHENGGRVVFEYEPVVGSFFLRSRAGGSRTGCKTCVPPLTGPDDKTLLFESRFESGNLAKAVQISEFEYELWLRNDLYTNKHTQWFYFRFSNARANVNYRFTIVNLTKPDSLYNHGMKPLMYSERAANEKKIGWVRSGSDIKYYRNNIKYNTGKTDCWFYSLTWTASFKQDQDTVYFAHCYPYSYTDMQDYLNDIANDPVRSKICKQRVLCRSLAGNLVYVLTITSATKVPEEAKHRKAVVVTSRVHPGESNASWMLKGFLDYLMGNSADAKLLRDTFVFKIIPILNPDGVIVGNYRCSLSGRDLNRNYKTVLKESFPSIWHTKSMIKKLLEEREITVYCDLHGHSRKQNVFLYGCENRNNPNRRLRERVFPVMLSRNAPDKFSFESCKFKVQKGKEGTGRIVIWNYGILNSFTMEATFCGSSLGKKRGYHFNTADFESMGYHFCDTLLDYCDPDNTKVANILLELEERVRQEILHQLKMREGQESAKDLSDINLDDDYTTELESSDGGSDSSVSDGLPMHLQYVSSKMPKKKRLKSRKERDKVKALNATPSKDGGKKLQATPILADKAANDRFDGAPKIKNIKFQPSSPAKLGRAKDPSRSNVVPMFPQEKLDVKKSINDNYLDALTKAYVKKGVLTNEDRQREVPHFRYTAASMRNNAPPFSLPPNASTDDPKQKNEFFIQPTKTDNLERTISSRQCPRSAEKLRSRPKSSSVLHNSVVAGNLQSRRTTSKDDLEEGSTFKSTGVLPRRKAQSRVEPVITTQPIGVVEPSRSSRHIVEFTQQQTPDQEKQKELNSSQEDLDPAMKPLERERSTESVDQVSTSNHLDHARSLGSLPSDDLPEGFLEPAMLMAPDTFNRLMDVRERKHQSNSDLNDGLGRQQRKQASLPPFVPPTMYRTGKVNMHMKAPRSTNDFPNEGGKPLVPYLRGVNHHSNKPISPANDLTTTMQSINEIREALMDPTKRTNLSPTTGQFVDHFVKKTDAEINEITSELQQQFKSQGDTVNHKSTHLNASKTQSWKSLQPPTAEFVSTGAILPLKRPNNNEIMPIERTSTKIVSRGRAEDFFPVANSKASVAFVNINELSAGLESMQVQRPVPLSADDGRRKANEKTEAISDEKMEVKSANQPRLITSPTKISLMISKTTHEDSAGQFHAHSLTQKNDRPRQPKSVLKRR